jgi:hypothetical protein
MLRHVGGLRRSVTVNARDGSTVRCVNYCRPERGYLERVRAGAGNVVILRGTKSPTVVFSCGPPNRAALVTARGALSPQSTDAALNHSSNVALQSVTQWRVLPRKQE